MATAKKKADIPNSNAAQTTDDPTGWLDAHGKAVYLIRGVWTDRKFFSGEIILVDEDVAFDWVAKGIAKIPDDEDIAKYVKFMEENEGVLDRPLVDPTPKYEGAMTERAQDSV